MELKDKAVPILLITIAIIAIGPFLINAAQTGMFFLGPGTTDCRDSISCFTQQAAHCGKAKANFSYYPQWPLPQEYFNDTLIFRISKGSSTYMEVTNNSSSVCGMYVALTVKAIGSIKAATYNMTCYAPGSDIISDGFPYQVPANCSGSLLDYLDSKNLKVNEKLYDISGKIDAVINQTDRIENNQIDEKYGVNSHIIS
jgi:hypothetical protein